MSELEQKVTFKTAKLAKDKGFKPEREWNPAYVTMWYDDDDFPNDEPILTELKEENYSCECHCLAPTQTTLQKWLREKYKIHISIYPIKDHWECDVRDCDLTKKVHSSPNTILKDKEFLSYEMALEEGLYQALKLI